MNHTHPHLRERYRWPHPIWLWLVAALALILLLFLWSHSAAAQGQRGLNTMRVAITLQPDLRNGKVLYARACSSCHGRKGYGKEKSLTPAVAGQVNTYTIKQLVDSGEGDRSIAPMHRALAAAELTNATALANVAGYIASLPANQRPQRGPGSQLKLGMEIYSATCANCHGTDGSGNAEMFAPSLRGQHYTYLVTQMRQMAASHRYAVDPIVVRLLEALTLEQLTAVADTASRLPDLHLPAQPSSVP